jgi:hypothetical protein
VAARARGRVTVTTDTDAERWLPLAEAAAALGRSRHRLRRRVGAGRITSRQVQGPHGLAYESLLDSEATVTPPLAELVTLARDLQADVVHHAATAALYQEHCRVLEAQAERLRALPAPVDRPGDDPEQPTADGSAEPARESATSQKRP